MQKWLDSPTVQAVLAAMGRGLVLAAAAYFGMLIKHVSDVNTIIGTVGLTFIFPLAGVLHLVVPSVPGATMATRWPRLAPPSEPPDPPRPEQSSDRVAAAVQRDRAGRFAARVIPPMPPTSHA